MWEVDRSRLDGKEVTASGIPCGDLLVCAVLSSTGTALRVHPVFLPYARVSGRATKSSLCFYPEVHRNLAGCGGLVRFRIRVDRPRRRCGDRPTHPATGVPAPRRAGPRPASADSSPRNTLPPARARQSYTRNPSSLSFSLSMDWTRPLPNSILDAGSGAPGYFDPATLDPAMRDAATLGPWIACDLAEHWGRALATPRARWWMRRMRRLRRIRGPQLLRVPPDPQLPHPWRPPPGLRRRRRAAYSRPPPG